MKFNLKMFINVLPKKSVLKKNKWVLVILALVILIGLYWYSKKSQENYYNSKGEGAWGGSKTLKKGSDGNFLPPVRVETEQATLFRFSTQISGIRDAFYKVEKKNSEGGGPTSTDMFCTINRLDGTGVEAEVTDLNDYGTFIDIKQKDTTASIIWTGINGAKQDIQTKGDCQDEYSPEFTTHQQEINKELLKVDLQIKGNGGAEPEYINEIVHEEVTLYLGNTNCPHSNDFLTKIWTDTDYTNEGVDAKGENLRQQIIDKLPGIELDETQSRPALVKTGVYAAVNGMPQDIIRCEHTDDDGDDLSDTLNKEICKLAGFYGDDKTLSFPLIQYSFLGKTNKDGTTDGYTRYTANFDPTKKVQGKEMVDEESDGDGPKTVFTSAKIIAWLSNLRGL